MRGTVISEKSPICRVRHPSSCPVAEDKPHPAVPVLAQSRSGCYNKNSNNMEHSYKFCIPKVETVNQALYVQGCCRLLFGHSSMRRKELETFDYHNDVEKFFKSCCKDKTANF